MRKTRKQLCLVQMEQMRDNFRTFYDGSDEAKIILDAYVWAIDLMRKSINSPCDSYYTYYYDGQCQGRCRATKEQDVCSCGGDESKCEG